MLVFMSASLASDCLESVHTIKDLEHLTDLALDRQVILEFRDVWICKHMLQIVTNTIESLIEDEEFMRSLVHFSASLSEIYQFTHSHYYGYLFQAPIDDICVYFLHWLIAEIPNRIKCKS